MSDQDQPIVRMEDVKFGFPARSDFLGPIRLEVKRGECWGIIGPNGAGKSTLLRIVAGLLSPGAGRVWLNDAPVLKLSPRERARHIALMPQSIQHDIPNTAMDVVLMGRFPHRQIGLFEGAEDHRIAEDALRRTSAEVYSNRSVATLSGGEAQRVHLAAALAQQPDVLLLDEPTSSLDLYHQLSIFKILSELAANKSLAVIAASHDINLAARFCTHILLLNNGKQIKAGVPSEVIRASVLEPVYGVELAEASAQSVGRCLMPVRIKAANPSGMADRPGNS